MEWMSWLALADILVLLAVMGWHASMRRDGTYWWNPPTKDWKDSDGCCETVYRKK